MHPAPSAIDLIALREMTSGDVDLESELLGHYIETAERCIAALENAIAETEPWLDAAFELKNASANFHACAMEAACAEALHTGDATPRAERERQLQAIRDAYHAFREFLHTL